MECAGKEQNQESLMDVVPPAYTGYTMTLSHYGAILVLCWNHDRNGPHSAKIWTCYLGSREAWILTCWTLMLFDRYMVVTGF